MGQTDQTKSTMMKAATVVEQLRPLEIRRVPIPEPGSNQIRVKITASSLCMSDIAGYVGKVPIVPPYFPGHEPVGIVDALGSGVQGFNFGDRVGFMMTSDTCGDCDVCIGPHHRFCEKKTIIGFNNQYGGGGFSEYTLSDPRSTVKLPEKINDEHAAPLLCSGVTAYSAIRKVAEGQTGGTWINILGIGGVGHLAVAYAKALGYRVRAWDIDDRKLDIAKEFGAEEALNSNNAPNEAHRKTKTTVVISGAAAAYDLAFRLTDCLSRIVAVGIPPDAIRVNILDMVLNKWSLVAIFQGTKEELRECLNIAAEYNIRPIIECRKIDDISRGFEDLMNGKVAGRLVYKFD